MSLDKMSLDKMSLDKMPLDKMSLDKMSLDKMSLYKIFCDRMPFNKYLSQHNLRCQSLYKISFNKMYFSKISVNMMSSGKTSFVTTFFKCLSCKMGWNSKTFLFYGCHCFLFAEKKKKFACNKLSLKKKEDELAAV